MELTIKSILLAVFIVLAVRAFFIMSKRKQEFNKLRKEWNEANWPKPSIFNAQWQLSDARNSFGIFLSLAMVSLFTLTYSII